MYVTAIPAARMSILLRSSIRGDRKKIFLEKAGTGDNSSEYRKRMRVPTCWASVYHTR
jgi:hypothetical protein